MSKGRRTYVFYFASSALEWYPEWNLDLGVARKDAATVNDLLWNGIYRRDFANAVVLVNPTTTPVRVDLGGTLARVDLQGGDTVSRLGAASGQIVLSRVTTVEIAAKDAVILMREGHGQRRGFRGGSES